MINPAPLIDPHISLGTIIHLIVLLCFLFVMFRMLRTSMCRIERKQDRLLDELRSEKNHEPAQPDYH